MLWHNQAFFSVGNSDIEVVSRFLHFNYTLITIKLHLLKEMLSNWTMNLA